MQVVFNGSQSIVNPEFIDSISSSESKLDLVRRLSNRNDFDETYISLDQSTNNTGFAVFSTKGNLLAFGVIKRDKDEDIIEYKTKLKMFLKDLIIFNNVKTLVYEEVYTFSHYATKVLHFIESTFKELKYENEELKDLVIKSVNNMKWKAFVVSGKLILDTKSQKKQIMEAVLPYILEQGFEIDSMSKSYIQDIIDAIGIGLYYYRFNLSQNNFYVFYGDTSSLAINLHTKFGIDLINDNSVYDKVEINQFDRRKSLSKYFENMLKEKINGNFGTSSTLGKKIYVYLLSEDDLKFHQILNFLDKKKKLKFNQFMNISIEELKKIESSNILKEFEYVVEDYNLMLIVAI